MHNYRCNKITDIQKARYREVNRKTAAAKHLKNRVDESVQKQEDRERQQKCWLMKCIPNSPSKFCKMVQSVVRVAEK